MSLQKQNNQQKTAKILTFAGALPFIFIVAIKYISPYTFGIHYNQILLIYSAIIIAFIAGTHWAFYLLNSFQNSIKYIPDNLLIHSNIVTLIAYGTLISSINYNFKLLFLISCFLYLLGIDKKIASLLVTPQWYIRMRLAISFIVVTTLLIEFVLYSIYL